VRKSAGVLIACLLLAVACGSDKAASTLTSGSVVAAATTAPPGDTTAAAASSTAWATTIASAITAAATVSAAATTVAASLDRPYDLFVPKSYTGATAVPLVVLLHGYTANGALQEFYFKLQPLAEAHGFLYVHPDGLKDGVGNGFWNATDACCDLGDKGVDDVAYLSSILDQVQAKYKVDPKRIYFVGHSNGGFMSYRMACDRADRVAAIVSLAGGTWADVSRCKPSQPVSILQIHGTKDSTIPYAGGQIQGHKFPSAEKTVATWAAYNGCAATPTASPTKLDLDAKIDGTESTVSAFSDCKSSSAVELWTIDGGIHTPPLSDSFSTAIIDFLLAHPKP
jgi:polyhydroxybutyrate depolymerase